MGKTLEEAIEELANKLPKEMFDEVANEFRIEVTEKV